MAKEAENREFKRRSHSLWWWIRAVVLSLAIIITVVIVVVISRAEPILKGRVIETLATRFHGPVELSDFHVSLKNGFLVSGHGLRIFGPTDPNGHQPGIQPLISIDEFRFGADILNLLQTPMRIRRVYLKGLE